MNSIRLALAARCSLRRRSRTPIPACTCTGFAMGFAHPLTGLDHLLAMVAVGFWAASLGGAARWIVPGCLRLGHDARRVRRRVRPSASRRWNTPSRPRSSCSACWSPSRRAFRLSAARRWSALFAAVSRLRARRRGAGRARASSLFGAGFVLATAALHGVGLGLGALRFGGALTRVAGFAVAPAGVYFAATV